MITAERLVSVSGCRSSGPARPKMDNRTTLALIVVDTLFVRTANDPVRHDHRLGAGPVNRLQHFLGNDGIVADVGADGEPAPESCGKED